MNQQNDYTQEPDSFGYQGPIEKPLIERDITGMITINDGDKFWSYLTKLAQGNRDIIGDLIDTSTVLLCNVTPVPTGAVTISSEIHNSYLKRLGEAIQRANTRLREMV